MVEYDEDARVQGGQVNRAFTVVDAPQRSPEWFQARAGCLTGSRAADMLDVLRSGGESARRRDYKAQLVAERLSGRPQESGFVNEAMQRGIDCEPLAIGAFEAKTGLMVQPTGFLRHTALMAGCSLDGHIGDFESVVEVKCPKTATHLAYLKAGIVPHDYRPQILHNLWITGAQRAFFVSWDDRLPAHLALFVQQWTPTQDERDTYERKAVQFLDEVATEVAYWEGVVNV